MSAITYEPDDMDYWEEAATHMGAPGLPDHIDPERLVPRLDVFGFLTGSRPPVEMAAQA